MQEPPLPAITEWIETKFDNYKYKLFKRKDNSIIIQIIRPGDTTPSVQMDLDYLIELQEEEYI